MTISHDYLEIFPAKKSAQNLFLQIALMKEIVVISDEEKEVEILGYKSRMLCYGMLFIPGILRRQIDAEIRVSMRIIPYNDYYVFSFQFQGEELAIMNDKDCRIISNLIQFLKFECFLLPDGHLKLLSYGKNTDAKYVGQLLYNFGLTLYAPDIQPKEKYVNPQQHLLGGSNTLNISAQVAPPDQMDELYKSFTNHQELDEMEPNSALITKLYKFQRQALYWLCNAERSEDLLLWNAENGKWKNLITDSSVVTKPNPIRGGILADDMGLGKTIQIIALILTSPATTSSVMSFDDVEIVREHPKKDIFGFVPANEKLAIDTMDPAIGRLNSTATLIICPLSLVHNWEEQILAHTAEHSLSVLVYHGPQRTEDPQEFLSYVY
jgi:hypothetical protein